MDPTTTTVVPSRSRPTPALCQRGARVIWPASLGSDSNQRAAPFPLSLPTSTRLFLQRRSLMHLPHPPTLRTRRRPMPSRLRYSSRTLVRAQNLAALTPSATQYLGPRRAPPNTTGATTSSVASKPLPSSSNRGRQGVWHSGRRFHVRSPTAYNAFGLRSSHRLSLTPLEIVHAFDHLTTYFIHFVFLSFTQLPPPALSSFVHRGNTLLLPFVSTPHIPSCPYASTDVVSVVQPT